MNVDTFELIDLAASPALQREGECENRVRYENFLPPGGIIIMCGIAAEIERESEMASISSCYARDTSLSTCGSAPHASSKGSLS